ncbi:hypothetical protein PVAND_002768 [Polypedilum vanderplanki]|uniref:PH domain-containing protein n=1 Tax=Polypedilum vanderplanki TaxID=319348 RepID=A0A9J6BSG9_POLVA|nr:hypothetical protein PVAND_002768 [Polypedilum vanderplanki]
MEIIKSSFLSLNTKKVFTILCIHNEGNSPLLEVYAKKVHSSTHMPHQVFDLKLAKYVGIKIPRNISETSYEFVIAFENEVVSFGCKRWELMNDWVYCLKTKLRELKVLSPKENIYTKTPVMRPQFMQRRNPREDPLPERPAAESQEIPGLEFVQTSSSNIRATTTTTATSTLIEPVENEQIESLIESFTVSNNVSVNRIEDDSITAAATAANPISIPIFNFATSNTSSQNLINLLSNPLFRFRNNSDLQFANNFDEDQEGYNEQDDEETDNDDDENIENGEDDKEIVLPTSLNIEYVPPITEISEKINTDDNITIIPVTTDINNSNNGLIRNGLSNKIDESKVTKIKIEIDYDNSKVKESSHTSPVNNNNHRNGINDDIKLNQAASTSSFIHNKNMVIEKKELESVKSAPSTPKKINPSSTPKSTPLHEKRKLSLREQQVLQLKHEINTEIRFRLRKKDCVDAIAFASYSGCLWIAGFKPNPQLYVFHIGDQLVAINNIANIKSPADAQKFIKMSSSLFVEVTIKRLPLAGIYVIKREFENQCLGLIRDRSSLLDIIPNSIASRAGIPARPYNTSENEDETVFWIITEINFRPLSLISHKKYDETELLLNAVGLETSLLLQPSNFVAKIQKELKAMKNYRDYTLQ